MAQEETTPVSDESKGLLEDVKKGKPRKFAMICKGTEIVSLVVFKKGNVEKHKKEAKQAGKGQFYFGVVEGKGQDIRFVLSRADGFDSGPVKTTVLKSFLEEAADLKCKPLFEIVDAAPLVLDEDDPLVARFRKLQTAALAACDNHPDRAAEINSLCRQVGGHLDGDQPDAATGKLNDLETLLNGLAPPQPVGETPPKAPPDDAVRSTKLVEGLKKLKPAVDAVVLAQPQRKAELIDAFTKVAQAIKTKQWDAAQTDMLALAKLIKSLSSSAPPDTWTPRLESIRPRFDEAVRLQLGDTGRMRALWAFATEKGEAGDFASANKALDGLEKLLEQAFSAGVKETDVIPEGIVAAMRQRLEKARIRWDEGLQTAASELKKVQDGLNDTDPELAAALSPVLVGYRNELDQILRLVASAKQAADAEKLINSALETVGQLEQETANDGLLALLDTYAETEVRLQDVFERTLSDVRKHLEAA